MLAIIAGYFILLLVMGFYTRKTKTLSEFMLAGKNLSFWVLVASIATTFYGATAILGGAELSFYFGLGALWFMIPFYLGNILVFYFIGRIEKSQAETLPDFLGQFYGSKTVVASALLLSFLCLVPGSIIAAGKIMHFIQPVSPEFWMTAVTAVITVYTLLGGMRAVSYSDVLQFVIMIAGLLILLPFALQYSPDFINQIPAESKNPFSYSSMFPQNALRWAILLLFLPITSAPLYQRFFATQPKVNRKKAIVYTILFYMIVDVIVLTSGLIAQANAETLGISEENADIAFIILGLTILPAPIKILFSLGMLAAIMSTADSWLHAGGSSLAHDVLRKLSKTSEEKLVVASRILILALGLVSLALALYFNDFLTALTFLLTVWISGILVPTLAILSNKKITEKSAFYAIIAGGLSSIIWGLINPLPIDPLFVGLAFSFSEALLFNRQP